MDPGELLQEEKDVRTPPKTAASPVLLPVRRVKKATENAKTTYSLGGHPAHEPPLMRCRLFDFSSIFLFFLVKFMKGY